ncbi:pentapeptide repeat-containing protein [Streptomyces cyaneofuscatus]|uniref:pentapeptide repeat-containing protein n=1 Tax=Streptomyces cyaneofuscatus TaxID=66883 RepID=UPI00381D3521
MNGDHADPSGRQAPSGRGRLGLLPVGWALALTIIVALLMLTGATLIGGVLLGFREIKREPQVSAGTLFDLLKVSFALIAGAGGLVALVMAYRRQRLAEYAHELDQSTEDRERTRIFNERFSSAAGQLGHEQAAVRLAGVYAMAALADDWQAHRQTCIDVLCAYLRMAYPTAPADTSPEYVGWLHSREIRHTVIRVITAHLRDDAAVSWCGHDFDFTGTVFDGGDFTRAKFTGGTVIFERAKFPSGEVAFHDASFAGGVVGFWAAEFQGGRVYFPDATFCGGTVSFEEAKFVAGLVCFDRAKFVGGRVHFRAAEFDGGEVNFLDIMDWSRPPEFDTEQQPTGVLITHHPDTV